MFHAGVVRALVKRFGFDVGADAHLIGTSAGSSVAAGLRLGHSPDEILAELDRPPSEDDMAQFRDLMDSTDRSWRPLQPALVRELRPGGGGAGVALAGLLPPGRYPTWPLARIAADLEGRPWPDRLWITAADVKTGTLTVFGRDDVAATVGEAIEASSAVPGLMEPKHIAERQYVDGGAISPTNATLAIDAEAEFAVISSPMTRPSRRLLGRLARRRLDEEVEQLDAAGIRHVVVAPPDGTDGLFRDYPRRDRSAGRDLRILGEAAVEVALNSYGLAPGDLG
jgi:NTE family protein